MKVISSQINLLLLLLVLSAGLLTIMFQLLTMRLSSSTNIKVTELLDKTLKDLDILTKRNLELQEILIKLEYDQKDALRNFQQHAIKAEHFIRYDNVNYVLQKENSSIQYEISRRRISTNIQELSFFINFEIMNLQRQVSIVAPDLLSPLKHILDLSKQHIRWLLRDLANLVKADGYGIWRKKEANKLDNLVQTRLHYLQNPPDCKKAKKVVCSLDVYCGFGCQLHHIAYCFIVAYGTQRTLILQSERWQYHTGGWEEVFKPISEKCTDVEEESSSYWPGNTQAQVLTLPLANWISPKPEYLPPAIPEDLAPRLIRLHGNPVIWWVGQFFKYIFRPQEKIASFLQNTTVNFGFRKPIVGVHVRRTDKIGSEASYHDIEEYMNAVDEYYNQLELKEKVDKRRIYLATDDPKVITEVKTKYLHYEILGDPAISKNAALSIRYSATSLQGIILDVYMLSLSDFLVCTFTSQVCKLAYGLMQNHFPDASAKFRSLDDIYDFDGQSLNTHAVVLAHDKHRSGEIQLMPDDLVSIESNCWNGYSKGRNVRTNQTGLFPSFKVRQEVETAKFPTYSEMYKSQREEEDISVFSFLISGRLHVLPILQLFFFLLIIFFSLCLWVSLDTINKEKRENII